MIDTNHFKQSKTNFQTGRKNPAFENISVDDHDQAANTIDDCGYQCVFSMEIEEVVTNIECSCDVLVAFEVSSKTQSGYANKCIIDPTVLV